MYLDLKKQIDCNTILVEEFNTPFSAMDRSFRQKINKETSDMNCTREQMDLTNIYRTFHPTGTEYTLFSTAHQSFSRINRMLSHKISLLNLRISKSYQVSFLTTMV
uniref:Uncharacterized protein n=1 Tax=Papio anubis TaxID=9555 RepID=A0A8I5R216_PAPAN